MHREQKVGKRKTIMKSEKSIAVKNNVTFPRVNMIERAEQNFKYHCTKKRNYSLKDTILKM